MEIEYIYNGLRDTYNKICMSTRICFLKVIPTVENPLTATSPWHTKKLQMLIKTFVTYLETR